MPEMNHIDDGVYRKYHSRCLSYAVSLVGDREIAESIVSDAFLVMWQKYPDGMPDGNDGLSFLFAVIRNKSRNSLRSRYREMASLGKKESLMAKELDMRLECMEEDASDHVYESEIMDIVNESMSAMSDRTSEVFRLSRFEGLSYREISTRLDMSEKTVEYHLSKMLKHLRKILKEYLG